MVEVRNFSARGHVIVKGLFSLADICQPTRIGDRIYRQWLGKNRARYVKEQRV